MKDKKVKAAKPEVKKTESKKEYTATRGICGFDGKMVKEGGKITLSAKEAEHFKGFIK